ncbi:TadE/TadG family type IV pilus assembly protein [Roseobacter ponti]|uniref:Pilus assembly protein n=1 Tax=Roseobacter ponti TaxID=1891787 RepID=A0A858SU12_9RHOB|nr:TadE/TadG family type IV pilus assembly protein [Roseobacter ponti]QJF51800.1 pilus assembly protein [Roseobacter ponti]
MKRFIRKSSGAARPFGRDENGSTMIEYAVVLPLFLLLLLGIVDFGRYGFDYIMTKKAMERGTRVIAVRNPVCPGVPNTHNRAPAQSGVTPPAFGTSCSVAGICENPGTISCSLNATDGGAGQEIWARISAVMPSTVIAEDVTVTYAYNSSLGFLGGPYVPEVTVELTGAQFEFVTPLGGLATLATGIANPGVPEGLVPFPSISVTMPGEDLALGNNG